MRAVDHKLGKVPGLDGLRGLAVALVVLSHLQLLYPFSRENPLGRMVRGGSIGVDLFFVLSGFLITTLLVEERAQRGRVALPAFYARRALRLLPALYLLFAALALYTLVAGLPWGPTVRTIAAGVLYVNNWQFARYFESVVTAVAHLWSLSIEEQFYLVWPALLILIVAPRRRWTGAVLIGAAIVAVAVYRARLGLREGWLRPFLGTDTRADSLLVGALLAWLRFHGMIPARLARLSGVVGLAALAVLAWYADPTAGFFPAGGFTLIALAAAALLFGITDGNGRLARAFDQAGLRLLGRISYGLYLWHHPVFYELSVRGAALAPWLRVALALGLTAACTAASWHFVERPARRLRGRFEVHPPAPERAAARAQT